MKTALLPVERKYNNYTCSSLWLTEECLILAQFGPDQSVGHWEMAEEMFSVAGWSWNSALYTGAPSKQTETNQPRELRNLDFTGVGPSSFSIPLPRTHDFVVFCTKHTEPRPCHMSLCGTSWTLRANVAAQSSVSSQLLLLPPEESPRSKVCLGSLWLDLHTPRLSDKAVPTLPVTPAGRCDSGPPVPRGQEPQSSKITLNSSSFLLN